MRRSFTILVITLVAVSFVAAAASAKNPYRNAFFSTYPVANNTQLDDLPSNPGHCGMCHFDFNGSGPRNAYGLQVEVGLNNGLTATNAILAIEGNDSDGDGYTNLTEITAIGAFTNTPTFPGLSAGNVGNVINIPPAEVTPYLTPQGATDTTPPTVTVTYPNGGESFGATSTVTVTYSASDNVGVDRVEVYFSDDSGSTYSKVANNLPPTGSFSWFVENLPGTQSRIRVEAYDLAGNDGEDASDADFTVTAQAGIAPTTLRDMKLSGTQPFEGAILEDPSTSCVTCHGNYNQAVEPWFNWHGSMMGQAARDPLFFACVAVAEQDAPSVGDLCIRCHTPGGWQEGRSADTGGGMLTAKDRQGVQCDFCHRGVDYDYVPGVSPAQDVDVLAGISPLPLQYGNGQFITDPAPLRRGPYADAQAAHEFVESPFHREADICGTCHDVSSPVYEQATFHDYVLGTLDQEHPDMDLRNMLPIERTFSEWQMSEYASTGVYAPQFAGAKADGIVSTCQDCHMADASGKGAVGGPTRGDIGVHDFTGGNTFIPDIIPSFYPGEVDVAALQAGKARATAMLQKAATLELTPEAFGVTVRVTNETGHKLPSGYPEGRRIWLNVRAVDALGNTVYESAHYDFSTAELTKDEDAKVYEIKPGLSSAMAGALSLPQGPSFHFVLNDTVYGDNRIPPRGFTNAGFEAIQSPPVHYSYADGQYWDETGYNLPGSADSVYVTLYYQTLSKEYVTFLRDENETNTAGDDLYAAWEANGMSTPVVMASGAAAVEVTTTSVGNDPTVPARPVLGAPAPSPFRSSTTIRYTLTESGISDLAVYDISGRRVREVWSGHQPAGEFRVTWDGRDDRGVRLASGVYFLRLITGEERLTRRVVLMP